MDGLVKGTLRLILSPYLIHFCLQIFRIAYCDLYEPSKEEELTDTCSEFVYAVHQNKPEMSKRQKIHLMLHLVECMKQYGPTSSFNSER